MALPFRIEPLPPAAAPSVDTRWAGSIFVFIWTKGTLCIGAPSEPIEAPFVALHSDLHQALALETSAKSVGWVIEFHPTVFPDTAELLVRLQSHGSSWPARSHNCAARLTVLCEALQEESYWHNPGTIGGLLHALFSLLDETQQPTNQPAQDLPPAITQFLALIEAHYKISVGVAFYAEKLNISTRHLNRLCQISFGYNSTAIVENRRLTEARRLLLETDKTVAEIGFELGYNEKSYFSRVFHRKTGITPTAFRQKQASEHV